MLLSRVLAWFDQNVVDGIVNGVGATVVGLSRLTSAFDMYVVDGIVNALAGITHHAYFDTYSNTDVIKETHWYRMSASSQQPLIPQTEEDITAIRWVKGKDLQECLENSYENIVEIVGKLIG